MSDVDKHIVKEKDGWWFWDEIGLHTYGPYRDKKEARLMLHRYCKEVLDRDLYWPGKNKVK